MTRIGVCLPPAAAWTRPCSTLDSGSRSAPRWSTPAPIVRSGRTAWTTLCASRPTATGPGRPPTSGRSYERPVESLWSAWSTDPSRKMSAGLLGAGSAIEGAERTRVGCVGRHGLATTNLSSKLGEHDNVKRTPLKRRSERQQEFDASLAAITPELWRRAEGSCELMIPTICAGKYNLHRHHRRSRRVRKDGKANILSNLLLVCMPCHELIHHERAWARKHGFIISSGADPDKVHVNRSGVRWMPN